MGEFDDLLPSGGFDDLVPANFSNVQSGAQTTAKPLVQFNPDQPNFGSDIGAEQRALQGSEATRNAIAAELPREAGGSLLRSVSGLLGAAGGGLQVMYPGANLQDDAFKAADQVKAMADSLTANDQQPAAKFAGNLIGGAAGGFVGDPMSQGMQTLREGGSLGEAEKRNAIGSTANVLGLGLGALGSQAEGVAAYASRAAYQVPGNVAIAAGTAELEGRDPTMQELGTAAGMGLAGAVMRSPEHVAALDGKLGPEAQGSATAQTILQTADHVAKVTEGEKNPLTPEVANGPAAPVDAAPRAADVQAVPAAPVPKAPELPMLYHGTNKGFGDFGEGTEGSASDPGVFGRGGYATTDPRLASIAYAKGEGANVRQVQATLENPKVFDSPQAAVEWQGERGTDSPEAAERVRQKYLDAGHDGVIIKNNRGLPQEVVTFDQSKFRSPLEKPDAQAESPTPARDQMPPEPSQEPVAPTGRPAGDSATVESAEGDVTRIRKADVISDREERGVSPIEGVPKEKWDTALDNAKAKIAEEPSYAHSLAQDIVKNPRAASTEEIAALAHERRTLDTNYEKAASDVADAIKNNDPEAHRVAKERFDELENRLDVNDQALLAQKTHAGRALNIQKLALADDYSLARIKNVAKAKSGQDLSATQEAKLRALTEQVAAHKKALEDLQAKMDATGIRQKAVPKTAQERAQANTAKLLERLKAIPKEKQMIDPACVV